MQLIKGRSSYEIRRQRGARLEIWQAGSHKETLRDEADHRSKLRHIEQNLVTAKLVEHPAHWPSSSACRHYQLDPIPQRLKPLGSRSLNV